MKTLATLYGRNVGRNGGRLPADEVSFRAYIRNDGKDALSQTGVTAVDELFVSSRDGKPLVVVYRNSKSRREYVPELIVVHEAEGLNGKRLAAVANGTVVELDRADFEKLNQAGTTAN